MAIAPAVIRLYARAREIECEVDAALDDCEPVAELLERCERGVERCEEFERTGTCDDGPDEHELARAKTKAAALAQHREYRWARAELGRLLELGPADVNPLDDLDREREGADDPGVEASERAIELRVRLDQELICWWRRGARPGDDLAVVGLDGAAAR